MIMAQRDPHKLLTRAKAALQRRFKPKVLNGKPLDVNAGDAEWYQKRLESLVAALDTSCVKAIRRLHAELSAPPSGIAMDASIGSQARIAMNSLRQRFFLIFRKKAHELSAQMVFRADKASSASLHASLKELSGGLSIALLSPSVGPFGATAAAKTTSIPPPLKEAVKMTIHGNVRLIKSIAAEHLDKVEDALMRSIAGLSPSVSPIGATAAATQGKGLADLIPELEKIGGLSRERARLIAHDQTKKATTAFHAERMKAAGIRRFKWLHSGGLILSQDVFYSAFFLRFLEIGQRPTAECRCRREF
jgi:hypothetical protein